MTYCLKCGNCCIQTEMPLSNKDIQTITQTIKTKVKFYEEKDGYLILKNISGNCIFFDITKKNCKIYENRPQGCRFYPFIYNNGKCIVDVDCKNRKNIKKIDEKVCRQVKNFVDLLEKEREKRINYKRDT
ncbi:MAG: YkgJ family cysteine cluster protein [Candidatus Helarchaeota archaeon]